MLEFEENTQATPYHFAFDIPVNMVQDAFNWLDNKVVLLSDGDDRLIQFENWNAQSMYFYDPDQNIVEFIARKNKGITKKGKFSCSKILALSEIGLSSQDLGKFAALLKGTADVGMYSGDLNRFAAIGNEEGLVIAVQPDLKDWFPNNDKVMNSPFELVFRHSNKSYKLLNSRALGVQLRTL
jgi:hypothetical protein